MLSPFAERLRDYLRAGYPALAVVTHEEERLLGDLLTLRAIGWSFVAWSIARGWVDATDLGFPASVIEWHQEPVRLRGPTIEVPGYAHLVIRGWHVGPGANDLGFVRGPEGAFHALVGVMEQRTRGWHGPYDQGWLGQLAAAYAVRQLAAQYQAKGWRVAITRQPDGVVELIAEG